MTSTTKISAATVSRDAAEDLVERLEQDWRNIQRGGKRGELLYEMELDLYELRLIAMAEHPDIRAALTPGLRKEGDWLRDRRGFKTGEVLAAFRAGTKDVELLERIPNPRSRQLRQAPARTGSGRDDIAAVTVEHDEVTIIEEESTDGGLTWQRGPFSKRTIKTNRRTVVTFENGASEAFLDRLRNEAVLVSLGVAVGLPFAPPWLGAPWGADWSGTWVAACILVGLTTLGLIAAPQTARLGASLYGGVRGALIGIPVAALLSAWLGIAAWPVAVVVAALCALGTAAHFRQQVGRRVELLDK